MKSKAHSTEASGNDTLPISQSSTSRSCDSLAKATVNSSKRAKSCEEVHTIDKASTSISSTSNSKLSNDSPLVSSADLLTHDEPSPLKREPSLPMSKVNHASSFDAFAQRSRSFSARRPLQVNLQSQGNNLMAGSKKTAATPDGQDLSPNNLEDSSASRNNRVMTWMNNAKRFWSSEGGTISKPPVSLPAPPDMSQTLPLSQSVRGKPGARELTLLSESARLSKSSAEFKDHVYEDIDVFLKSTVDQRKAKANAAATRSQSLRPRPKSARVMLPYVTREVSISRDGKTCFATDV